VSARFISSTEDAEQHAARSPNEKVFYVQARAAGCELVARRTPWGSTSKRAEFGTIKVLDSKGAVVREGQFSTDGPHESRCPLPGEAGAQFKVLINDDQRGVWTLSGEKLGIVVQTSRGYSIGGVGRKRYHFFVPAGTQEFRVKLAGRHTGVYGGAALTPTGEISGVHQDLNPGQPLVPRAAKGGLPPSAMHSERGTLTIRPAAADTGKVWTLILWAAVDIGVELEGVPPYLALSPADWFEPRP
jgi:hypothetical protein